MRADGTVKDIKIKILLKYLSIFWRDLEILIVKLNIKKKWNDRLCNAK